MIFYLNSDPFFKYHRGTSKRKLKLTEPWNGAGYVLEDTGLCNRIFTWDLICYINKQFDNKFEIEVEKQYWPELEFLHFPNTTAFPYDYSKSLRHNFLKFITSYDEQALTITKAEVLSEDKIKQIFAGNRTLLNPLKDYYTTFGCRFTWQYLEVNTTNEITSIRGIIWKNKLVQEYLKDIAQNMLGIHIRRGHGVKVTESDLENLPEDVRKYYKIDTGATYTFYKDSYYYPIIEHGLNIKEGNQIYLSTDTSVASIRHIKLRYNQSSIVTVDDIFTNVIDLLKTDHSEEILYIHKQTIINLIDLFTLSYCKGLISSPMSTWSLFAGFYHNSPSILVSKPLEDIKMFIDTLYVKNNE